MSNRQSSAGSRGAKQQGTAVEETAAEPKVQVKVGDSLLCEQYEVGGEVMGTVVEVRDGSVIVRIDDADRALWPVKPERIANGVWTHDPTDYPKVGEDPAFDAQYRGLSGVVAPQVTQPRGETETQAKPQRTPVVDVEGEMDDLLPPASVPAPPPAKPRQRAAPPVPAQRRPAQERPKADLLNAVMDGGLVLVEVTSGYLGARGKRQRDGREGNIWPTGTRVFVSPVDATTRNVRIIRKQ